MREFDVLHQIFKANDRLGSHVIVPPGDDLAAVMLADASPLLAGVDQVVEGRHFDPTKVTWHDVGRKAMKRSLSDIAAMAGQPLASLATGVFPPDFPEADALALCEGLREAAEAFQCPLIGGDIATGDGPVVCTVTVLAVPGPTGKIITRSGAKPGDHVYVTGRLGGAWHTDRHLTFTPRIELALALVERFDIHAMIDLSDGLGRDLDHIAEMSQLRAAIDAARVPCHAACDWQQAIGEGEDYELCFTLDSGASIPDTLLDVPLTRIGELQHAADADEPRTIVCTADGERLDATTMGWEHGGTA